MAFRTGARFPLDPGRDGRRASASFSYRHHKDREAECKYIKGGLAAALFYSVDEVAGDATLDVEQVVVAAFVGPGGVADEGVDVVDAAQEAPRVAFDFLAFDRRVQGVVQVWSDVEGALQTARSAVDVALERLRRLVPKPELVAHPMSFPVAVGVVADER